MEVHPIQRFPFSETGRGLRKRKADEVAAVTTVEVKMKRNRSENDEISAAASPSINLGLQIGTNSAGNRNERTSFGHRKMEAVLTVGQLQELEQQVLIHKHLAAGLRVPTHLLVPIWKSVAKTLGSNVNGVNERCNGFIGYSPGLDYRSMMDPEPGRCRRTDGKKWRCSRDTIPDQKYCERHMHRGRQRSRKPVEASENDSPSKKVLLNTKTKNQFSCDFPPVLPFPSIEALAPGTKTVTETISSSLHGAAAIVSSCADATKTIRMIPSSAPNAPATYIMTIPSTNPATTTTSIPTSYDIFHLKDVRNMNFRESCCKSRDVFGRNDINVKRIQSPGLGFSPSSVLQVPGCSSSLCGSKINLELEPGRCRRTDGKKWRCRRDVIPNQKYCGLHMHRGSKKQMKPSQNAPVLASTRPPLAMMALTNPDPATPNTNLSMSIQPGNNRRQEEERSSNASSSSETTITDTTITG